MNPGFGTEVTIGIFPIDFDRSAFNTGNIAIRLFQNFCFVAFTLAVFDETSSDIFDSMAHWTVTYTYLKVIIEIRGLLSPGIYRDNKDIIQAVFE